MNPDFSHIFTKEEIHAQLERLGARRDGVVLMHSSLRSIGSVEGGAQGLLDPLLDEEPIPQAWYCGRTL